MPLIHSKKPSAFKKNVEEMYEHGHPLKQALAAAYSEKRSAEHKADGGCIGPSCKGCSSSNCMSEGGEVKGVHRSLEDEDEIDHGRPGQSRSGYLVSDTVSAEHNPDRGEAKENAKLYEKAKNEHYRVLGEMKFMKKPNLMAEGGSVEDRVNQRMKERSQIKLNPEAPDTEDPFRGQPQFPSIQGDPNNQKPEFASEGGEMHAEPDADDELQEMLGHELMEAIHSKDKKAIMSAIEACVMQCLNKGEK